MKTKSSNHNLRLWVKLKKDRSYWVSGVEVVDVATSSTGAWIGASGAMKASNDDQAYVPPYMLPLPHPSNLLAYQT